MCAGFCVRLDAWTPCGTPPRWTRSAGGCGSPSPGGRGAQGVRAGLRQRRGRLRAPAPRRRPAGFRPRLGAAGAGFRVAAGWPALWGDPGGRAGRGRV